MSGIVYCLTNPAMPGYVKIGRTDNDDLVVRLKQLDTTSVPLPFECVYAVKVDDPIRAERLLHDAFADHRVRSTREFFEVGPPRVVAAMQVTGGTDVTPGTDIVEDAESQRALNEARSRRENFNFGMVGIPVGTQLYFLANSDDSPAVTAIVTSNNRISLDGAETSLSGAAGRILRGRGMSSNVAGTEYWYFEGESLADRRRRMESEG